MINLNILTGIILSSHFLFAQRSIHNFSEKIVVSANKEVKANANAVDVCAKNHPLFLIDSVLFNSIISKMKFFDLQNSGVAQKKLAYTIKELFYFGVVSHYRVENMHLYLIKFQKKDTLDWVYKHPETHIDWVLCSIVQNNLKSIFHLSTCHKDLWYGSHEEFSIVKNKIYLKYIADYSDDEREDDPKDGVEKKEVYTILSNGYIKQTSKWEYKRKKY